MRGQQGTQVAAGTAVAEHTHLSSPPVGASPANTCSGALFLSDSSDVLLHTSSYGNLDGEHRTSEGLCVLGVE